MTKAAAIAPDPAPILPASAGESSDVGDATRCADTYLPAWVATTRSGPRDHGLRALTEGASMLAYDYPLLGVFWSMLIFFLFFAWIVLLFRVFVDIFRAHDMGGFAKGLWCVFVIVLPFLGVLIYLMVHGGDMTRRSLEEAQQSEAAFQSYVRDTASTGSTAEELSRLAALRDQGVLTDAEFQSAKAKLLAR